MAGLIGVAFDGLVGARAVLGSVGVGEAGPGGVIAGFDSGKPGRTNREASRGMEIENESLNARKVVCAEGLQGRGGSTWWG